MADTNTIVLKGRRFDATTGKAIDGVQARSAAEATKHAAPATAVHQNPQHTKTLSRTMVHKPKSLQRSILPKAVAQHGTVVTASFPAAVSQQRIERAGKVEKSGRISRFSDFLTPTKLTTKIEHIPLKQPPAEGISHHLTPPVLRPMTQSERLFSAAMNRSTSHTEKHSPKRSPTSKVSGKRLVAIGTTFSAVVILAGFFFVQQSSNVEFRMAASRAGIAATLPTYKPAGFSVKGPVASAPGQITIRFGSASNDQRSYTITQRTSNWNSQALVENFLASAGHAYQTAQSKGRTLYLYNGNATWVDGGIWYQVEGDANLSANQLLHIASSM